MFSQVCHKLVSSQVCHKLVSSQVCHKLVSSQACYKLVSSQVCHKSVSSQVCHRVSVLISLSQVSVLTSLSQVSVLTSLSQSYCPHKFVTELVSSQCLSQVSVLEDCQWGSRREECVPTKCGTSSLTVHVRGAACGDISCDPHSNSILRRRNPCHGCTCGQSLTSQCSSQPPHPPPPPPLQFSRVLGNRVSISKGGNTVTLYECCGCKVSTAVNINSFLPITGKS